MTRVLWLFLALVLLELSLPAPAASQEGSQTNKTWISVGYGTGSFGVWSGGSNVAEIAHQRGANIFALHQAGRSHAVYEWIHSGEIIYRRVVAGRTIEWSVGTGIALADIHICDDSGERNGNTCPCRLAWGMPMVAEVSAPFRGFVGGSIQAFANLNQVQSFIVVALALRLGDLR
jgi:hypothetical protein